MRTSGASVSLTASPRTHWSGPTLTSWWTASRNSRKHSRLPRNDEDVGAPPYRPFLAIGWEQGLSSTHVARPSALALSRRLRRFTRGAFAASRRVDLALVFRSRGMAHRAAGCDPVP